jgi:uncharacterized membrane protein
MCLPKQTLLAGVLTSISTTTLVIAWNINHQNLLAIGFGISMLATITALTTKGKQYDN